jgi:hypothetical protein
VPDDADLIECTYDWLRDDDIRCKVFVSSSNDLYFAHQCFTDGSDRRYAAPAPLMRISLRFPVTYPCA